MLQLYLNALKTTQGIIANVKPDQLGTPSNCAEWDTRGLLNHVIGGVYMFATCAKGETPDMSKAGTDFVGQAGDDAAAAYATALAFAEEAWQTPDALAKTFVIPAGEMPGSAALRIALMEAVVHGWDVAKSTGQDHEIDPMLGQPMLSGVTQQFANIPRGEGSFLGPIVEVPEDASVGDKLVAFLGRTP